ncbi:hypothetical protein BDV38DRAFT_232277 [Aspergillus pseudotamarii]|uniref:L-ornithine N(5)-oxygenase n=1 Tax=Aspergillus pseudotamarii TaxID=132259 RepID=A0A5N6TCA1_ASPPS|nr:uncharacterized protein BDV38DRAFT_232277 [Aspergillus pseudotamarii]KAE8143900.1 hypothetical protein BDV38DRAFT_232277 [Aspergillus pseudotamarii]
MSNSSSMPVPALPSYSQVACIGAGASAIALGASLKRWYSLEDIRFFERQTDCGGTWHINTYPGCACDVPSALYSFSFAPNAQWSKLMPSQQEIKAYQDGVVATYDLRQRMIFRTEVTRCVWRDDASRWVLFLRNVETGEESTHECQVLFSATGHFAEPRPCEIPGASSFQGDIIHSARWDPNVSLEGKRVVVVGNGCTAAQIVPAIVKQTKSLTQIIRSQHWIFPATNFTYPKILKWIFEYIPFALKLHRLHIFLIAENGFRMFPMTNRAARLRQKRRKEVEKYMKETAPPKYHDILIPDFEIGCKRRIFDDGYLKSLHSENLSLTTAKILEIVPEGVRTSDGIVAADVIVLATGFKTNQFTPFMEIVGRDGSLTDHWKRYDGPEAYNCSAMSGFPNFFLLFGPNAGTGHTSALMAAENSVNYALRVLKPVFEKGADSVELTQVAEDEYSHRVQDALRKRVWNAGCQSWYQNDKNWNAMAYPWSQAYFWYRSLFPINSHWNVRTRGPRKSQIGTYWTIIPILVGLSIAASRTGNIWTVGPMLLDFGKNMLSSIRHMSTSGFAENWINIAKG